VEFGLEKKKPHMNLFFQPFHSELQRYYEKGFEITVNGKKELSPGVAITGAVDSPAKSDLKNMAHHNGNCGCPYCLHPGKHVSSRKRRGQCIPTILLRITLTGQHLHVSLTHKKLPKPEPVKKFF